MDPTDEQIAEVVVFLQERGFVIKEEPVSETVRAAEIGHELFGIENALQHVKSIFSNSGVSAEMFFSSVPFLILNERRSDLQQELLEVLL